MKCTRPYIYSILLYQLHDKRDRYIYIYIYIYIQGWINLRNTKRCFSPSLHDILKNLQGIIAFRNLKCPDPSMIPLLVEVKECLQKLIWLTSYILIYLGDLLYKRLILHDNMEFCCSFKSFASGTCGFSYREDRSCISQVVPLCSCQKDISSHLRSCKFSIILSGAGIFETPKDIDDFTIYPTHRWNLGVGWSRDSNSRYRASKEVFGHNKGRFKSIPKADRGIGKRVSQMYSRLLKNSYNLAAESRLYLLPCAKLRVPSDLGFDRELVKRLPKIQTETEFYILMSEHFVGFPPSSGTRNYAHGGKGYFYTSY